jgi:hypothetical protein
LIKVGIMPLPVFLQLLVSMSIMYCLFFPSLSVTDEFETGCK